jgi:serine protease AprX
MTKRADNIRWAAWALVALAVLALGGAVSAQSPGASDKFDEVVRKAVLEGRPVRAIVRFSNADARLRGAQTVAARGGQIHRTLNSMTGLTVDLDPVTAQLLAADEGTLALSIDATVRSNSTPSGHATAAPSSGAKTARQRFNSSGRGVSVAIIDSGVQPHLDLPASRIRRFVDFVNGRQAPYDDFGHGTHVAGIVAGSGANSSALEDPYTGAAPEVDVVALKVLDSQGAGRTSDVIAALEWVATNHLAYNIRVVNLSLGHPVYEPAATDPLVQAAEALVARGIVVVASAGNLGIDPRDGLPGYGGITSPANGPRIIAVGAVDGKGTLVRSDDTVTDYSSRGPTRFDLTVKPDLVAQGHRVVSLAAPSSFLFSNYPNLQVAIGTESPASYMLLSGTSMAAPMVSGTAALILEANKHLSVGAVRAVLAFTAQTLPHTSVLAQGAGQLNALGALRLARLINANVPPGHVWLKSIGGLPQPYDTLHGEPIAWAKNIVWGQGMLLGDSAYVHLSAWADNIVWGQYFDNIVWGQHFENIVWGQCAGDGCDNMVWGQCSSSDCDNIVWGQHALENIVWGQCSTSDCDNIVWGQCGDNIVWGQDGSALGYWASNTVWGFWDEQVNWTAVTQADNIVWGQDYLDNIVWGQCESGSCDNIVWGQRNIVWGQSFSILTGGPQ